MRTLRTPLIQGLLAAGLVLGGAACSGDRAAENAAEEAAERSGEDVEVDIDGDEVVIEGSDGTVVMGGDLPDDFPADEIPLVEGEVMMVAGATDQGWSVTIAVDGTPDEAVQEAVSALEGAGFTVEQTADMGGMVTAELATDAYRVAVTGMELDGATSLVYAVQVL